MNWLLVWILASAVALPAAFSTRDKAAARHITANTIAAHVRFLADDLLEGRAPSSRGSELGMRYIAAQFERLGLVPAGDDGSWLQRFDIVGMKSEVTTPITVAAGGKSLVIKPVVESVVSPGLLTITDPNGKVWYSKSSTVKNPSTKLMTVEPVTLECNEQCARRQRAGIGADAVERDIVPAQRGVGRSGGFRQEHHGHHARLPVLRNAAATTSASLKGRLMPPISWYRS